MDWTSFFAGGPFASLAPQLSAQPQATGGAPGSPIPDAVGPTSYGGPNGPQPLAQPTGILNGQPKPPQGQDTMALASQALKSMAPQASAPPLPQIQMAKALGSQGINPMQFLAAFGKNPLSAVSGMGA